VGCDIESLLQQAANSHHFQLSGHWLEVYGRCQNCITAAVAVK
jgi:Fe2+ or Zn2+ uptake regulation protein